MDVDVRGLQGSTPLILASDRNALPIVKQLLALGADVNAQDDKGRTALSHAAGDGHIEIVKLLVKNGALVSLADNKGFTPICESSMMNCRRTTQYLVDHGADPNQPGQDGKTAMEWLECGGIPAKAKEMQELMGRLKEQNISSGKDKVMTLMNSEPNADIYAAVHGRTTLFWGFGHDNFGDKTLEQWAKRVYDVITNPELLAECEERYLEGDDLEDARKVRLRHEAIRNQQDRLKQTRIDWQGETESRTGWWKRLEEG